MILLSLWQGCKVWEGEKGSPDKPLPSPLHILHKYINTTQDIITSRIIYKGNMMVLEYLTHKIVIL
jgi:hypothetical protein